MHHNFLQLAFALIMSTSALSSAQGGPRAVIELFTSQGCSDSPTADVLVADLASKSDLIVLSFPVPYWDYLGWKDTLAQPEFAERQRAYAARLSGGLYTPQLIVNGRQRLTGSDRDRIEHTMASLARQDQAPTLPVEIQIGDGSLSIRIGGDASDNRQSVSVWLVRFEARRDVDVKGGENRGRRLSYTNVVREIEPVARWHGAPLSLDLPVFDGLHDKVQGLAVLVQLDANDRLGPIIGAAMLRPPS